jgi:hypothetical protein
VDLALTDSGVTQRLSILTGKPSAGNVAVLRRADRSVRINASGTATAHVNARGTPFDAHLTLHAYSAYLGYFLPSRHAHPRSPDKAFLQIDVCYQSADFVDSKTCHGFRSTDQSIALTGGGVIPARDLDPRSNDSSTIVFEVPATFTSGTLRISGSESSSDGWSMTVAQPYSLKITIPG